MPANCMPGNLGGFDVMYERKTWKNRETEFPGRRRMTAVDGQEDVFDVSREEGLILEEGDAFDADTMNNMEQRVGEGFSNTCQYLYKATFLLDSWNGSSPYTQTAVLTPADGGPDVTGTSVFVSPVMCEQTTNQKTNEQLQDALAVLNAGQATLGENQVTVTVFEKPESDIEAIWQIRKGGAS